MNIQTGATGVVVIIDARASITRDTPRPDFTSGIPLTICPDLGYESIILEN